MTETQAGGQLAASLGSDVPEPGGPVEAAPARPKARTDGLIAWAALSLGFLAFIAFGSVDARIWRFSNLQIESRSVLRIWTLQAETLPRVAQQWMLTSLFYGCILLVIACTVIGIWLLLDSAGTGRTSHPDLSSRPRDDPA